MPLTQEERAEINRENARKSTGPKTREGKNRARANALKHGLRAEVLVLPNEDAAQVEARVNDWFAYYQPESPAAVHLTNQCIRATLLSDRLDRFQTSVLSRQVREAERSHLIAQQTEIERLRKLLHFDPASAVRQLKQTSAGCLYLMDRWMYLAECLQNRGFWDEAERMEAIQLQGADADPSVFCVDTIAALTHLHALLCNPDFNRRLIEDAFQPGFLPTSLRILYSPQNLPSPEEARQRLTAIMVGHMAWLQENEPLLHEQFEVPALAEAAQRAMVIDDPDLARLFLRYSSEARSGFTRAYKDLLKTLDNDRDASATPDEPAPIIEAVVDAPEPADAPEHACVEATPEPAEPESEAPPNEATAETEPRLAQSAQTSLAAPVPSASASATHHFPVPARRIRPSVPC